MIASIVLVLAAGMIAGRLFARAHLPALLGMILAGMIIGPYGVDLLSPALLAISADLRLLALVIILLRAGLELDRTLLRQVGPLALKMGVLPCLMEGFAIAIAAHLLLGVSMAEAGMLGAILAAATPAVIVPAMLELQRRNLGTAAGIPTIILAGASIDDVFAITIFGIFAGLASETDIRVAGQLAWIPVQIAGGIALGLMTGWLLSFLYRRAEASLSRMEQLLAVLATALGAVVAGEALGIAGMLAVMVMGLVLQTRSPRSAQQMAGGLDHGWEIAQIFLFVLIGAEVNLTLAISAGLVGLAIIGIGLLARALGVGLSLAGSQLDVRERLYCAVANTPKATVQAAIGGIPLSMGLASGPVILAIAVLAVVLTASLGSAGIHLLAPRWLAYDQTAMPQTANDRGQARDARSARS